MRIKLLLIACFSFFVIANAQQNTLSSEAEVSVLTIGQGTSLNDAFGHSAFRIKDQRSHTDLVFNYGVYDFNTPNFYTKFAQGKLNYLIGLNYYEDFYESYIGQNRTIEEQILNVSLVEKQRLFDYLINNYKPENRAYLYDFFYDNCATRMRDVLEEALQDNIVFNKPKEFKEKTFRQLIYENVNKNSWGSFGIDVALGSVIDKKATPEEHMFLPKYIYAFFDNATINNTTTPLVKQTKVLFEKIEKPIPNDVLTSPLMVFGIISLVILFITYSDHKKNKQTIWLDVIIFSVTGIIGVLIILLWFATDHSATAQNYNLLWAFALNLFMIAQLFKKNVSPWFIKYLKFLVILLCLLVLHWSIGVQVFAIGLMPLIPALAIRYLFLTNFLKQSKA